MKSQNLWRVGIIDGTDYQTSIVMAKARVLLKDKTPNILTKPLNILQPFTGQDKVYFMPKVGDRVIVLTDENCEDGIILGSLYYKQNMPPSQTSDRHIIQFDDGSMIEYDKATKKLRIDIKGDIEIVGENIYFND